VLKLKPYFHFRTPLKEKLVCETLFVLVVGVLRNRHVSYLIAPDSGPMCELCIVTYISYPFITLQFISMPQAEIRLVRKKLQFMKEACRPIFGLRPKDEKPLNWRISKSARAHPNLSCSWRTARTAAWLVIPVLEEQKVTLLYAISARELAIIKAESSDRCPVILKPTQNNGRNTANIFLL
jgi:hypothetical protein